MDCVTVVAVNYRTARLIRQCMTTLMERYPDTAVILVDNGSGDDSTKYIKKLERRSNVTAIYNRRNQGHGPALAQGIEQVGTPYLFTLDSDCIVHRGGFLESMVEAMEGGDYYAAGARYYCNVYGLSARRGERMIPMIHPSAALIETFRYRQLTPAIHCGAPLLRNFAEANALGWEVLDWPIGDYVEHLGRGTRAQHGACKYDRSTPIGDPAWKI